MFLVKEKPGSAGFLLLLCFLVNGMGAAPITEFIELNLTLNKLFVLASPVVDALTFLAGEFYKLVL